MTGRYEANFLLFANAWRAGCPLLTAKYLVPETHRISNARGLPGGGGMLTAGIDSHIIRIKQVIKQQ